MRQDWPWWVAILALGCLIAIVWSMFLVRRSRRFDSELIGLFERGESDSHELERRQRARQRGRRGRGETP